MISKSPMIYESAKRHLLKRKGNLEFQNENYQWVLNDPVVFYLRPYLYYLSREGLLAVDEQTIQSSRGYYYQQEARWLLWHKEFLNILNVFHSNEIEVVPIKAFAFAWKIYPLRGLRAFSDIDLLVKPAKYLESIQLLIQDNYELLEENLSNLTKSPEKVTEVSMRSPQGYVVEIHQNILPVKNFFRYEKALKIDLNKIWNSVEMMETEGHLHYSLNLSFTLAHLCLHAATHGLSAQAPFTYLDIDCWIRAEGSNIQWAEFIEIVKEWKIRSAAYHTFQLCKQIYNTPFPPEVIRQLNPGFWAKWRVSLVYSFESYISHDLKKPGIRNPKWVRLMLHDQFTDILKILLGGLFPTRELRKNVYGTSVSLPAHWSRIHKKITSPP